MDTCSSQLGPMSMDEVLALQEYFRQNGWDEDGDAIEDAIREVDGQSLTCHTCGRVGNREDGIEPGGPCQEPCLGTVVRVEA